MNTLKTLLIRVILVAVFTFIVVNSLFSRYVVHGNSMQPTLAATDSVMVSRNVTDIQRGDVLIFQSPYNTHEKLIKRVIALPHDTLLIRDNTVYVNGTRLDEPYTNETTCQTAICETRLWQLGADEYFMMGDNRQSSHDSRHFGAISGELILGKATLRYYPLTKIKHLN